MKYYKIFPPLYVNRDFSFNVSNTRVIDYFKFGEIESGFLRMPVVNLKYETIFESELLNVLSADFYYSSSGILLFSKKFHDEFKGVLSNCCEFFKCSINGKESEIYALNIINYTMLLDDFGNFKPSDKIDYLSRDLNEPYFYVVTQEFVNLLNGDFEMQFLEIKD